MVPAKPPGDAVRALARLRRRPPARDRVTIAADVARILILKPHDQLGDFVLATPAMRALRARFPNARLMLVTREFLEPLARRVDVLDEVRVLPRLAGGGSLAALLSTVTWARAARPDVAFVLNGVSRSKSADAIAAWSGARLVVGRSRVFAGPIPEDAPEDPGGHALASAPADPLYDLDVDVGRNSLSQVDRLLDLVRWCTGPERERVPRLDLGAAERAAGRARLTEALRAALGETAAAITVGLHPGAANELKCWPLESFVELGVAVASAPAPRLVVFDSPRERGRAAALVAGLAARGVAAGLVPAAGIAEFAATCAALDLLACNDSGVMHIAAALGIPTVSFHSLGRPAEWGPIGDRAIALHAPGNIATIPIEAAIEAVRALLTLGPRP
jgi:ADP-heptose:LPS heptosyltransferase